MHGTDSHDGNPEHRADHRELLRQQTVLAQFGELALRSDDLDAILHEACRLVGEALGTDLAKVMELREEGRTLLVRAGVGWEPGVVGTLTLPVTDASSEGYALGTGEPMISADVDRETRFRYPSFLLDHGVRAVVNVVILGGRGEPPFGILQVDSREPRHFTEGDVAFLRSYANLLAAAVDRLRLIGDLRERETRLREGAERQRAALETGLIGFFEWDATAGTITADARFAGFCGLDAGALAAGVPLAALLDRVHPDDRAAAEAQVGEALAAFGDYSQEFRFLRADGSACWVLVRGRCFARENGRPVRYTGTAADVSASKEAAEALRRANGALEARVAERTRALMEANGRLRAEAAERERTRDALRQAQTMETVVENLPLGAALVAPSGQIVVANPEFRRMVPRPVVPSADAAAHAEWTAFGRDGRRVGPEDFPAARALRGEVALDMDFLHRGAPAGQRWRRVSGVPVRDENGAVAAALVVIVDVDDAKRAAERQALLTREVDHRAKNMLAVVQAAVRLTRAEDVASFVRAIDGRVAALARAQTVLAADRWSGADLHALLHGELAAFLDDGGGGPRAALRGPALALPADATQPFSMAIHELATNAVKYGALASPTGRLAVSWRVEGEGGETLRLRWAETGGAMPDSPPSRQGFGSRVLTGTLRRQLHGAVSMRWEATGLVCDIDLPLDRPARGDPADPPAAAGVPQVADGEA